MWRTYVEDLCGGPMWSFECFSRTIVHVNSPPLLLCIFVMLAMVPTKCVHAGSTAVGPRCAALTTVLGKGLLKVATHLLESLMIVQDIRSHRKGAQALRHCGGFRRECPP